MWVDEVLVLKCPVLILQYYNIENCSLFGYSFDFCHISLSLSHLLYTYRDYRILGLCIHGIRSTISTCYLELRGEQVYFCDCGVTEYYLYYVVYWPSSRLPFLFFFSCQIDSHNLLCYAYFYGRDDISVNHLLAVSSHWYKFLLPGRGVQWLRRPMEETRNSLALALLYTLRWLKRFRCVWCSETHVCIFHRLYYSNSKAKWFILRLRDALD